MRKILEQRLENARNDYHNCYGDIDNFPFYEAHVLQGQIEAYQDCLNLIPAPRTEQEILKDFEALGYEIKVNKASMLYLTNDYDVTIHINKLLKGYRRFYDNEKNYIPMQEHKLLNELFNCYGWI